MCISRMNPSMPVTQIPRVPGTRHITTTMDSHKTILTDMLKKIPETIEKEKRSINEMSDIIRKAKEEKTKFRDLSQHYSDLSEYRSIGIKAAEKDYIPGRISRLQYLEDLVAKLKSAIESNNVDIIDALLEKILKDGVYYNLGSVEELRFRYDIEAQLEHTPTSLNPQRVITNNNLRRRKTRTRTRKHRR